MFVYELTYEHFARWDGRVGSNNVSSLGLQLQRGLRLGLRLA